jgi:hypothetical protein
MISSGDGHKLARFTPARYETIAVTVAHLIKGEVGGTRRGVPTITELQS